MLHYLQYVSWVSNFTNLASHITNCLFTKCRSASQIRLCEVWKAKEDNVK